MYTICVKFRCLPQKREAFIQKVKDTGVLDAIRAEDGCIRYDYYLSKKIPTSFCSLSSGRLNSISRSISPNPIWITCGISRATILPTPHWLKSHLYNAPCAALQ